MTVDTETVSLRVDLLHKMAILSNLVTDQEERRADIVLCQHIQYSRRVARMRTVVEGESELAAGRIAAPERIGMAGLHPIVEAKKWGCYQWMDSNCLFSLNKTSRRFRGKSLLSDSNLRDGV